MKYLRTISFTALIIFAIGLHAYCQIIPESEAISTERKYDRNDTTYMQLNKNGFIARVDSVYTITQVWESKDGLTGGSVQVDSVTHFFLLSSPLLRSESFSKEYYIKDSDDLEVMSVSIGMLYNKKLMLMYFDKLILMY